MLKILRIFALLTIVTSSLLAPLASRAAFFDAGFVLADAELLDPTTMNEQQIQAFLNKHGGVLKTYITTDIDGNNATAAAIISQAAYRNQVNPQYLLTVLQKEQSLITDPSPTMGQLDWAMGYAACDDCDVNHPALQKYRGFAKQVDHAAWRTRYFFEHPYEFNFQAGNSYNVGGETVSMKNQATAVLYDYTPHIHGNQLLFQIFDAWFRATTYPDGTLIQAIGQRGVWLIENGQRHGFKSRIALTSRYRSDTIVAVDPTILEQYAAGPSIAFAQYNVVSTPSGQIYLLTKNQKRLIADDAAFKRLGYSTDEVEPVSDADIAYFADGLPITEKSSQPIGSLMQDPSGKEFYYVIDGVKHPLSAEILALNYPGQKPRPASADELGRYSQGEAQILADGLLIKSKQDPRVFVISGGKKHPIYSEKTFTTLGYQWAKIRTVSEALLQLHATGDMLRVEPLTDQEINSLNNS